MVGAVVEGACRSGDAVSKVFVFEHYLVVEVAEVARAIVY